MTGPLRKKLKDSYELIIEHHVMGGAAEMAYYLMMSVFPVLILVYSLLGILDLDWYSVTGSLQHVLPEDVLRTITSFGTYVERNHSPAMMVAAWIVIITSASALVRSIFNTMGDLQGQPRFGGLLRLPVSVAVAIILILSVYASIIVLFTGSWFLRLLDSVLPIGVFWVWKWVRFPILFVLLYFVLLMLYTITEPAGAPPIRRDPGAWAASLALVGVSVVFSLVISASTRYALVYGSLASVIIMLVWLYACSLTILLGNLLNYELALPRHPRKRSFRRRRGK